MKKITCFLLALMMIIFTMSSCDSNPFLSFNEENNESDDNGDQSIEGNVNGGDGSSSTEGNENENTLYEKYSNLRRIDPFHNGLAAFTIYNSTSTTHWNSTYGSWTGDYYYGFINTKGEVVIEPIYECCPGEKLPTFEYNYTKVGDLNDHACIIDKSGSIKFEVGQNSVSAIGKISEGYFWVETFKEAVSGNIYTVHYYSANDLSTVATFDKIRAIPDNRTIGGTNSTLTSTGEGKLAYNLNKSSYYNSDLLIFNIGDYDNNYSAKQSYWKVDLDEIEDFSTATYYYHVSNSDSTTGQLATVALRSPDNVWFYAIVDGNKNVLMKPQKDKTFPLSKVTDIEKYEFCKNLCPAKDADSGYWGYIDPDGNWKIQPQYSTAAAFSDDGYATVNDRIVIDVTGNVVLAPSGWINELVTNLSGTYKFAGTSYNDWYLTFTESGKLKITENMGGAGSSWKTGKYQIKGNTIVVSEIGYNIGCPTFTKDGEYTLRKEGNTLFIEDSEWIFSNANLPE